LHVYCKADGEQAFVFDNQGAALCGRFDHFSPSSRDSSEDYAANAEKVGRIQLMFVVN